MSLRTRAPWALLSMALVAGAFGCSATKDVDVTPTARLTVDAHVGKNFTPDSTNIGDIADDFTSNETVCAVVDVPGRMAGTVHARWMLGVETISEQSIPIMEGVNRYRFRLEPPAGGLRPGKYELQVYVDDHLADTEHFNVRGA